MKSLIEKRIAPVLNSPTNLLMVASQAIFILSLGRVITDALPTVSASANEVTFRVAFSDLTGAAFIYALMSAFIALVLRIEGRPRPVAKEDESIKDKVQRYMQDPEAGFRIAMYATLVFAALTAFAIIWELRDFSTERLLREFFARIWQHVLGGMIVLFGARAVVETVKPPQTAAPSGGADDDDEKTNPSKDAEKSDDSSSFMDRYNSWFENPRTVLKVGGFVLVYLALAVMISQLWLLRDFGSTSTIIGTIAIWTMLAAATGLVPMLFVWALDQLSGRKPDASDEAPNRISEIVDMFRKPEKALPLITSAIMVAGGLWFMVAFWSSRNATAGEFWAFILSNFVLLTAVVSIPLMAWSLWLAYVQKEDYTGVAAGLLDNPMKLSTLLIFVLVYAGLGMTILNTFHVRIWGPADTWFVTIQDLTNFGIPVAILIGVRAVAAAYESRLSAKSTGGAA